MIVNDKNGKKLCATTDRKHRWVEHFQELLNRDTPNNPINKDESIEIPHIDINIDEPKGDEIKLAIKNLKNCKAPGIDGIVAEYLKTDLDFLTEKIHELMNLIWKTEKIPKSWTRGLIIKIPKAGNLKDCKNWRGITLLPVVSKVMGRILINRIRDAVDSSLREEQAGFRQGRNTIEQIFILRNILEQTAEWQATLYINFVDFEKAFDSVHRDSLWEIMRRYGIPEKIINLVKALYNDFQCSVVDNNETTESFSIKTGVKQGCNMSGFLFLLVVDFIMRRTVKNGENGIRWKFMTKLDDLDFADDISLLFSKLSHLQEKTNTLQTEATKVGLKINAAKTKVMRINEKNKDKIVINGAEYFG